MSLRVRAEFVTLVTLVEPGSSYAKLRNPMTTGDLVIKFVQKPGHSYGRFLD